MKQNITALDNAAFRILNTSFSIGIFDHPSEGNYFTNVTNLHQKNISQKLASQGIVLLKNQKNALPLNLAQKGTKILVLGFVEDEDIPATVNRVKNEAFEPFISEGGSSNVTFSSFKAPINELAQRLGVEEFKNDVKNMSLVTHCNKENGNCVSFQPYRHSMSVANDSKNIKDIPENLYDTTLIFTGCYSTEAADRHWINMGDKAIVSLLQRN